MINDITYLNVYHLQQDSIQQKNLQPQYNIHSLDEITWHSYQPNINKWYILNSDCLLTFHIILM